MYLSVHATLLADPSLQADVPPPVHRRLVDELLTAVAAKRTASELALLQGMLVNWQQPPPPPPPPLSDHPNQPQQNPGAVSSGELGTSLQHQATGRQGPAQPAMQLTEEQCANVLKACKQLTKALDGSVGEPTWQKQRPAASHATPYI